jgi:glucose-6-phosphate 1-epimerase
MTTDLLTLQSADGARATIHPHGAQVLSWRPAGGGERLFLSRSAVLDGSAAIRGGVPVIFPQFAGEGPLPKHGFARNRRWTLASQSIDGEGKAIATWRLADDEATRAIWPQRFAAEIVVELIGGTLALRLAITNTGDAGCTFTAALHTYFAVEDVEQAAVIGLQHLRYRDSTNGGVERVETSPELRIQGEVDRIYFDAPTDLMLREPGATTLVQTTGFADAVIWNPGEALATKLADLEPGGWRRMLCIEAAQIAQPIRLAPGERWEGTQSLTARPLALDR